MLRDLNLNITGDNIIKVLNGDKKITITLFIFVEWAYKLMDKIKKTATYKEFKANGIFIAAQCCEHLNRAIVTEKKAIPDGEYVNVTSFALTLEAKRLSVRETVNSASNAGI